MRWDEIVDHLQKYPYLKADGTLSVFSSIRTFAWEDAGLKYGIEYLTFPLSLYYRVQDYEEDINQAFQSERGTLVGDRFVSILGNLEILRGMLLDRGKRIGNKLTNIIDELAALQDEYERAFSENLSKIMQDQLIERGNRIAKGKDPVTDLKVFLDLGLSETTNLTEENRIKHILALLDHFRLPGTVGKDSEANLKRLLYQQRPQQAERVWDLFLPLLEQRPAQTDQ
jgi:hypothetical protein